MRIRSDRIWIPNTVFGGKLLNFYLLVEGTAMSGEGLLSSLVFSYKNQFDQLVKGLYILQLQADYLQMFPIFYSTWPYKCYYWNMVGLI
jgi:hypothetical protein